MNRGRFSFPNGSIGRHTLFCLDGVRERRICSALTDAASHAARVTIRYLRDEREWSLVNSHLLVAALIQETTEWTLAGAEDPDALRASLQQIWQEQRQMATVEEQGQRLTATILTGGIGRVLPLPSLN